MAVEGVPDRASYGACANAAEWGRHGPDCPQSAHRPRGNRDDVGERLSLEHVFPQSAEPGVRRRAGGQQALYLWEVAAARSGGHGFIQEERLTNVECGTASQDEACDRGARGQQGRRPDLATARARDDREDDKQRDGEEPSGSSQQEQRPARYEWQELGCHTRIRLSAERRN